MSYIVTRALPPCATAEARPAISSTYTWPAGPLDHGPSSRRITAWHLLTRNCLGRFPDARPLVHAAAWARPRRSSLCESCAGKCINTRGRLEQRTGTGAGEIGATARLNVEGAARQGRQILLPQRCQEYDTMGETRWVRRQPQRLGAHLRQREKAAEAYRIGGKRRCHEDAQVSRSGEDRPCTNLALSLSRPFCEPAFTAQNLAEHFQEYGLKLR